MHLCIAKLCQRTLLIKLNNGFLKLPNKEKKELGSNIKISFISNEIKI